MAGISLSGVSSLLGRFFRWCHLQWEIYENYLWKHFVYCRNLHGICTNKSIWRIARNDTKRK